MKGLYKKINQGAVGRGVLVFLVLALLFIVGIAVGGFIAAGTEGNQVRSFSESVKYSALHSTDNPWKTVRSSALSLGGMIVTIWLSGLLPVWICAGISAVLVANKAVVTGYTVGMLFRAYKYKGIGIAVVSILPQYLVVLPTVLLVGAAAFEFSAAIKKRMVTPDKFKSYSIWLVSGILLSLTAALVDGFVSGRLMHIVM